MIIKFMLSSDYSLTGNVKDLSVVNTDPEGEYSILLADVAQPDDLKIKLPDGRTATPHVMIVKGKEYFVSEWKYSLLG